MPTPLWKTTEAFKRILEVLGPRRYSIIQGKRKKYDAVPGSRRALRCYATTFYETPAHKKNTIEIYGENGYFDSIDTILHELLHAAYPDKEEQEIEQLTEEIAKDLWTAND
jgi:hypothetical protein